MRCQGTANAAPMMRITAVPEEDLTFGGQGNLELSASV